MKPPGSGKEAPPSAGEGTQEAVALRYERDLDHAPSVVARGKGRVAGEILRVARENDVPVHEDSDLLRLLALCAPAEEIPFELYGPVAALLAYLYGLNGELAGDG